MDKIKCCEEELEVQKAYLILENGTIFEGKSFGCEGEAVGEIVFTTSMTGYVETLTDPSFYGQIVVQTFPLIGNYGVIASDAVSDSCHLKGYIVREWCQEPSNFRCEGILDTFLKEKGVVGLCGIDTRALTRIIREHGVMNGKIVTGEKAELGLSELKSYKIVNAVSSITCKEEKVFKPEGDAKKKVCMIDLGVKKGLIDELVQRGCEVTLVPAGTSFERIKELGVDGVFLSNGAGDPAENVQVIETVKKICDEKIPVMGVCLGHQILALSQGAKTEKMKYGHRGANQPAVDLTTGRTYITAQNHGYIVVGDSLPEGADVIFKNANDATCEGISYNYMPAVSTQFLPVSCGGPLDTGFMFDRFVEMMDK